MNFKELKNMSIESNKAELNFFGNLTLIEKKGLWKEISFYGSDTESHKKYANKSFSFFIDDGLGYSMRKYNSMKNICKKQGGKEMIREYGRVNAVAFFNRPPKERTVILEYVKKNKTKSFYLAIDKLFPKEKNKKPKLVRLNEDKVNRLKSDIKEKDIIIKRKNMHIVDLENTIKDLRCTVSNLENELIDTKTQLCEKNKRTGIIGSLIGKGTRMLEGRC